MDSKGEIRELAERIVHSTSINFAETLLEAFREEVERDLIRQGMGEPPVSEERLQQIKEAEQLLQQSRDMRGSSSFNTLTELLTLIDFLMARIAFLSQDNESWQDGYRRGLEDGKARTEAVAKFVGVLDNLRAF